MPCAGLQLWCASTASLSAMMLAHFGMYVAHLQRYGLLMSAVGLVKPAYQNPSHLLPRVLSSSRLLPSFHFSTTIDHPRRWPHMCYNTLYNAPRPCYHTCSRPHLLSHRASKHHALSPRSYDFGLFLSIPLPPEAQIRPSTLVPSASRRYTRLCTGQCHSYVVPRHHDAILDVVTTQPIAKA